MPIYYDSTILILIPGILISLFAQMKVQGTFNKYSEIKSEKGITGAKVARTLLDSNGLNHISIERIQQKLGDHYDPRENVIRLSPDVYDSTSISALGVCAHECGHAMQFKEGYIPIRMRCYTTCSQHKLKFSIPANSFRIVFQYAKSYLYRNYCIRSSIIVSDNYSASRI